MKYFTLNCNFNYADEFDVPVFYVLSEEELDLFKEDCEKYKSLYPDEWVKEQEWYFGTNEFIEMSCEEIYEHFNKDCMTEIPEDEANILIERVGNFFGLIDLMDEMNEIIYERIKT